jgi:hypothetical protein
MANIGFSSTDEEANTNYDAAMNKTATVMASTITVPPVWMCAHET